MGQGGQIRLTVQYYEFAGGPKFDPDQPIKLDILYNDVSVLGSQITYDPGDIQREALGFYSYVWTAPNDATIGNYVARWYGTIHGTQVFGDELFEVAAAGSVDPGSGSAQTLGKAEFVTFAGILNPLYVDPEELFIIFTESNLLEIAEAIHSASLDLKFMIKLADDEFPESPLAYEYVKAAAACALSKIYGHSSLDADGGATRFRLGDLDIQKGGSGSSRNRILPESALTWCELAGVLRKEIMMKSTSMKGVVKGSNYYNPIPRRHIRVNAGDWPPSRHQGDLDDEPSGRIR